MRGFCKRFWAGLKAAFARGYAGSSGYKPHYSHRSRSDVAGPKNNWGATRGPGW